ncbi:uncharacterized protein LOC126604251 [Malus sylvestris]|uniref:uncharacterized protein LOC126604251 n=1 Tax=Malus sylvestris TaxID=3752 RepID=UPI0021AD128B|nr:uncharacterized protein LOC126604251 [Malus sylvestris]
MRDFLCLPSLSSSMRAPSSSSLSCSLIVVLLTLISASSLICICSPSSASSCLTYFGLKGALGDRMFDLVTQQSKNRKLTFEDLVIAKGIYEKGTKDDIEEFIYQLLDVSGDGIVGRIKHNHAHTQCGSVQGNQIGTQESVCPKAFK